MKEIQEFIKEYFPAIEGDSKRIVELQLGQIFLEGKIVGSREAFNSLNK